MSFNYLLKRRSRSMKIRLLYNQLCRQFYSIIPQKLILTGSIISKSPLFHREIEILGISKISSFSTLTIRKLNHHPLKRISVVNNNFNFKNQIGFASISDLKTNELSSPDFNINLAPKNRKDFMFIEERIKNALNTSYGNLREISQYLFDSKGKYFRPMLTSLMARACNENQSDLKLSQREVVAIVEMIHTASLVHDDVIDASQLRRNKPTAHYLYGTKQAIFAGDYILGIASKMLSKIGNVQVVQVLSQVLEDLVEGEFMQLGSKEHEGERFEHYMKKTYKKTASLIANSCKAVSILSDGQIENHEIAFNYGRNVGIAFQLVDDYLDFTANEKIIGKPILADLKLGLATAPVLYAAMQFPELNALIMRRFTEPGDVERTRELVFKSDGVSHTIFLAREHCKEAVSLANNLKPSIQRQSLIDITDEIINRTK